MICIISEKQDLVTDLVIEWLVGKGKSFRRMNDDVFTPSTTIISNKKEEVTELEQAQKVWHRRGSSQKLPNEVLGNYPNRASYLTYLSKELRILDNYQEQHLRQKLGANYIGSLQQEAENNKLLNLVLAKRAGFKIPETLITTEKSALVNFFQQHAPIISKDLRAPVNIRTARKQVIASGVKQVTQSMIDHLASSFAPILLQQYVEKQFELRVFVVGEKLFPMAIFSQRDPKTKVDYRNYNTKRPNRCVPVNLPKEITSKIWAFMEAVNMNTGSIDIIVTPDNEYYFLEINPMGQFHWLSQNCNYQIEKEIAKILCDEKG